MGRRIHRVPAGRPSDTPRAAKVRRRRASCSSHRSFGRRSDRKRTVLPEAVSRGRRGSGTKEPARYRATRPVDRGMGTRRGPRHRTRRERPNFAGAVHGDQRRAVSNDWMAARGSAPSSLADQCGHASLKRYTINNLSGDPWREKLTPRSRRTRGSCRREIPRDRVY